MGRRSIELRQEEMQDDHVFYEAEVRSCGIFGRLSPQEDPPAEDVPEKKELQSQYFTGC